MDEIARRVETELGIKVHPTSIARKLKKDTKKMAAAAMDRTVSREWRLP